MEKRQLCINLNSHFNSIRMQFLPRAKLVDRKIEVIRPLTNSNSFLETNQI